MYGVRACYDVLVVETCSATYLCAANNDSYMGRDDIMHRILEVISFPSVARVSISFLPSSLVDGYAVPFPPGGSVHDWGKMD